MMKLLLSFVVALAAQPAPPAAQAPPPNTAAAYVVGPADVLAVKVFEEAELSRNVTVDVDGTITYPFLGRVPVSGKSVKEIEAYLTKALENGYLKRPQLSVEVVSYRSRKVLVLGEVRNPGTYNIEGQATLVELVAKAGSFTTTAGHVIIIQRHKDAGAGNEPTEVIRINVEDVHSGARSANLLLQDGDNVIVPPAERFYVTGFVRTPGWYVLQPKMTVQQAIAVAGGFTERGSNRRIKILRNIKGKDIEVDARLTDLVQPNDTIKVPRLQS